MKRGPPNELIPPSLQLGPELFERAATKFGTPMYLYDRRQLRASMSALVEGLPAEASVYYSAKANPAVAIIRELAQLCHGVEVSSCGELAAALQAGVAAKHLLYVGPAKEAQELEVALKAGVGVIVAESSREVALIFNLAAALGQAVEILLRINPGAGRGVLRMGGATQFGMDMATAKELIEQYGAGEGAAPTGNRAWISGIHGYLGTRLLDAEELDANLGLMLDMAANLQKDCRVRFPFIDLGGGFGVPLYGGECELDLGRLGGLLKARFGEYLATHPWTGTLAFEAGRYPAAPCGALVTRVVEVKRVGGKLFALVDGGIHVIGGRDGYLGARCGPFRVVREGSFVVGSCEDEPLTVCGPLCTPYDRLAAAVASPRPRENDLLVFYQAGAYGASASAGMFLSRGFPAEAIADGDRLTPICRSWGPEEALCAQSF